MLVRARSHLGVAAREDSLSVAENLGQRKIEPVVRGNSEQPCDD